jgi:hypothetical protein
MGADINAFAERLGAGGWEICRRPDGSYFVPPCVGERDRILFTTLGAYPSQWLEEMYPGQAPVEPVSPARGLPLNLSAQGREWAGPTVGKPGYVGHSWLLVSELLEFPWAERWAAAGIEVGVVETHVRARFLTDTLPALASLGPPSEVRLIFWVDY